jgi:D-threonate/D-erythronate kinase
MTLVRLVADDLTGALDSAVQFTGTVGPIPVYLDPRSVLSGSAAFDLATRDGAEGDAIEAAGTAAELAAGSGIAFKKIDSLLRGHWAAELAATVRSGAFRACILAPAFPAQGRLTVGGRQFAPDRDGRSVPLPFDIPSVLMHHGLRTVSGLGDGAGEEGVVYIADAQTQADLQSIVRHCKELPGPVLWCGSAGLATALAGAPPVQRTKFDAPCLVVIGTNHPVSQRQSSRLMSRWSNTHTALADHSRQAAPSIVDTMRASGLCLVTFPIREGIPVHEAANEIRDRLAVTLPAIRRPRTLVAMGGETLLSICRIVAADHLEVFAEYLPGIPVSCIRGGPWDGTTVVSKSGSFGAPDLLVELIGRII